MAISRSSIAARLEKFIRNIAQVETGDREFTQGVQLFDAGYVDSLGIVSLMEFIEISFGVYLLEEDIFDERFTTIGGMTRIIANRLSLDPAAGENTCDVRDCP